MQGTDHQGFSAQVTIDELTRLSNKAGKTKEQFHSDMSYLCALIVKRGTNKNSLLEKSEESAREKIEKLISDYEIKDGNKDSTANIKPDKIILSRIGASFPIYGSLALASKSVEPKELTDGLPIFLHFTGGASLIPRSDTDLYSKWKAWSKKHDILINGKKSDESKVERFGDIVHKSSLYNDSERKSHIDKMTDFMEQMELKRERSDLESKLLDIDYATFVGALEGKYTKLNVAFLFTAGVVDSVLSNIGNPEEVAAHLRRIYPNRNYKADPSPFSIKTIATSWIFPYIETEVFESVANVLNSMK
jgi:hypothetical protein